MPTLAAPVPLRQRLAPHETAPRHRHAQPYAALVLAGGYAEAGDGGRRWTAPGDVILHGGFEAHANRIGPRGAQVLNLPLPDAWEPPAAFMRIADPDAIVRLAERDPETAVACLIEGLIPCPTGPADWPDRLADLPSGSLSDWARREGLAAATVSRGFRQVFGVSPSRYRAEARARAAWRGALTRDLPLADLAQALGFADQAHMTRAVTALTGRPPGVWRSNRFKTAESRAA
ncbi:AraC-like DNA-binding protein [Caulobacter ginsengisoli]|uniref:AraC-like DNA-binding protein n=1 Tax=Caulobacter ginsengisoli TaxID=400775 RepID=A0ABU0IS27_9CAUL|nr:AraC family transcriptional regulator [Caulobacter ginsengisoli]MDQ0464220.1 AraC-like DNA-binding protein [Caulobacter ginsengisoli]